MMLLAALAFFLPSMARNYSYDKDILYRGAPDAYTEKMCRLDVAYEDGAQDRPVIVWHGYSRISKNTAETFPKCILPVTLQADIW